MQTDILDEAQARIDAGDPAGARELLRAALTQPQTRACAIAALARIYAHERSYHIALYLFEEAARQGENATPSEAIERCRAGVEASGFAEDFSDRGHLECPHCVLCHRAEHLVCPYCAGGSTLEADSPADTGEEAEELAEWEDSAMEKLDKAGRDVLKRARELADSHSVKDAAERAKALGREAAEKARKLAARPEFKDAAGRAKILGKEAGDSVRKALDTDTAREVRRSAGESGKSLLGHLREFVREERGRYEKAGETARGAIAIKWGIALIALIILLRILTWVV